MLLTNRWNWSPTFFPLVTLSVPGALESSDLAGRERERERVENAPLLPNYLGLDTSLLLTFSWKLLVTWLYLGARERGGEKI